MKQVKALVIRANGVIETPTLDLSDDMTGLQTLQGIVGGMIEVISSRNGWGGYCNEEGKLYGLPTNILATALANDHGWRGAGSDTLVGDVVFFGRMYSTDDGDVHEDAPEWLIDAALATKLDLMM